MATVITKDKENPIAKADPERWTRWQAHLARARAQAEKQGTLEVFLAQEANGEFNDPKDFN